MKNIVDKDCTKKSTEPERNKLMEEMGKNAFLNASKKFLIPRGNSEDFRPEAFLPGEMVAFLDRHTIAFCFRIGDWKELSFDENVTEETARELIDKITEFYERGYAVTSDRVI